jgi:hypothetical protein
VKTTAKVLAGLIFLALLGWSGTLLYWHLTLRSAILTFEERAGEIPRPWDPLAGTEAFDTIRSSGCRSLPYLVRAIASSKDPEYQRGLSFLVFFAATKQDTPEANAKLQNVSLIAADDSPADHQRKCDAIRDWWKQDGHLYHQWWRVWTSKCGSP